MNKLKLFFAAILFLSILQGCISVTKTMREPNTLVEFSKEDFTYSEQVTAEATQTLIFGIDFERLFKSESASLTKGGFALPSIASIPVIGGSTILSPKSVESLALYSLMVTNPGYDVVFYPQYEVKEDRPIGIRIFRIRTAKVTARLAKLN